VIRFAHSGSESSLIYALPTIRALGGGQLAIRVGGPNGNGHNAAGEPVSQEQFDSIASLLRRLPYLATVEAYDSECSPPPMIDVDLDQVFSLSAGGMRLLGGDCARWYSWITGVSPSPETAWISRDVAVDSAVTPDLGADSIVVTRTALFRNRRLNYAFMAGLNVWFVGATDDYEAVKSEISEAKYVPTRSALEMAAIVSRARCVVGTQSLGFAIAEAMKVSRVLEVYPPAPTLMTTGPGGSEALTQKAFERLVSRAQCDPIPESAQADKACDI